MRNTNNNTFIAYTTKKSDLQKSSSGGIFISMARHIIESQGVVYGSVLKLNGNKVGAFHKRVDNLSELSSLQGSKYMFSEIGDQLENIKRDVEIGCLTMVSGTPCQIATIIKYLDNYNIDMSNLITIDIICHGSPENTVFKNYIDFIENKYNIKVLDFRFRDKHNGWGLIGSVIYRKGKKIYKSIFPYKKSSYYSLFLKGVGYRDCCYSCPFAKENRISDITLGDAWGAEEEYPDYFGVENGLNSQLGLSLVIPHTDKGKKMFEKILGNINYKSVSFDKMKRHNKQLICPSERPFDDSKYRVLMRNNYKKAHYLYNAKNVIWNIYYNIKLKHRYPTIELES